MNKLPISCFIVYNNESGLIRSCVESVFFCDDINVLDISEKNELGEILTGKEVKIVKKQKQLIVELLRNKDIEESKHNWILLLDPDERIDPKLSEYLAKLFTDLPVNVAGIEVPWIFYFKDKLLKGTFWGNPSSAKLILFNKLKISYSTKIHVNHELKDLSFYIIRTEKEFGCVHHYWSQGFNELLSKHRRYLRFEGEHKYNAGIRFSLKKQYKGMVTDFIDSFIIYQGWKDGFTGLYLSLFYSYYRFNVWTSLKYYQKKLTNKL